MRFKIFFLFSWFIFLLAGCAISNDAIRPIPPADLIQNKEESAKLIQSEELITNPASTYCLEQRGRLARKEISFDGRNYGEIGYCLFADSYQCEEWALYRGYCPQGGINTKNYIDDREIYCLSIGGALEKNKKLCSFNNGAKCDITDIYLGQCGLYYQVSEKDWKYADILDSKILIPYHSEKTVFFNDNNNLSQFLEQKKATSSLLSSDFASTTSASTTKPAVYLLAIAGKIDEIPENLEGNYNKEISLSDQENLENGLYGETIDLPVVASQQILSLNKGINAKNFIVLSRGACDVTFENILIFYYNNNQIIIKSIGDKEKIILENPNYFTEGKGKCKDIKVWNTKLDENIANSFYEKLANKQLSGAAQDWLNSFNDSVENLVIF